MAPFFSGIAGAIKGQAGFGFGRRAGAAKSLVTTIYTYTGSWTRYGYLSPTVTTNTLAIPGDTTTVTIKCEGGGFGGTPGGGLAQGTFTNLAGKTLTATIRGGGEGGLTRFFSPNPSPGNNGLHYAGVFDGPSVSQPTALIIAGGAGCSGASNGPGGAGGGPTGGDGTPGSRNDYSAPPDATGKGSPGSSGGSGGSAWWPGGNVGSPGSALQGGTGGEDASPLGIAAGAGGGGGYWGGGGSGSGRFDGPNQAGASAGAGGGSGYVHPSATATTNTQSGSTVGTGGQITITVIEFK